MGNFFPIVVGCSGDIISLSSWNGGSNPLEQLEIHKLPKKVSASLGPWGSVFPCFPTAEVRPRAPCWGLSLEVPRIDWQGDSIPGLLPPQRFAYSRIQLAMADSVQVAPLGVRKQAGGFLALPWWQAGTLVLLIGWLYGSILVGLFMQWKNDKDYGHGPFVPAFALFVLWQTRHKLRSVKSAPSWSGLVLIVCALVVLILGVLGAELFLSRVSLLILVAGLVVLFRGWTFFRAVLFPWAILILMIPIPKIIISNITFPLQTLAAKVATNLLRLIGVAVLREGNTITLASMKLEVVEACSGIRSLLSLLTLSIIYGYLMENRKWVRVVLACSAVPIAVAANGFRIFGTGLMGQYWGQEKAEGFFHTFSGWLIFVVSLAILFTLHRVINLIWKDKTGAAGEPVKRPDVDERSAPQGQPQAPWIRFGITVALMLTAAIGLQAHSHTEVFPPREPLSSLPANLDHWTGEDFPIDSETLEILGAGEFLQRDYSLSDVRQFPVGLFVAYFPSQRAGDTIHTPSHCLPGAGWVPTLREVVQLPGANGTTIPANRYVVSKAGDRQLVLYWFQAHGRAVASEYWSKYYLAADSMRMNRSDGALVRLMTYMYPNETPEAAQARLWGFGSQLTPLLDRYIPR